MSDDIQTLKEQEKEEEESPLKENGHNPLVTPPAAPVAQRKKAKSGSLFGPLVLIVLGALFLGRNLGIFDVDLNWGALFAWWPLLLVFAGLNILVQQVRRPFGTLLSGLLGLIALAFVGVILLVGQLPFMAEINPAWNVGGEVVTTRVDVPGAGLEAAEVEIDFTNAGGTLSGLVDSNNLLSGEVYHVGDLEISEERSGDEIELRVREESVGWFNFSPDLDPWDLQLNTEVPLDLFLDLSNGSTRLELQELTLSALRIDGGNGSTNISLPAGSYASVIDGGNGSVTVTLPDSGQIELEYDGGNGSARFTLPDDVEARVVLEDDGNGSLGLSDRFSLVSGDADGEGTWETAGYSDSADNRIEIVLEQGNGSIRVLDE